MDLLIISFILGIVEGFTEFLPISSTGHLILLNNLFSFTGNFAHTFDIVIQLGAILAVIIYFRKKIFPFGKGWINRNEFLSLWKKVIFATIPAIIIGGLFGNYIEQRLFSVPVVVVSLIIGGIVLILIDRFVKNPKITSVYSMTYTTAILIGLIQCLALIPGTSRSAATIIGAMILGSTRLVAMEFSFYLAIPTMIAASAYSLLKSSSSFSGIEVLSLLIGFTTAFIVGFIVIDRFLKYIQNHDFRAFGYYRIILALIIIIYYLITAL